MRLIAPPEGVLTPAERLEALCDPGSLNLLRTGVQSRRLGAAARPGDGVLGGSARVDGRPVFCFAQDPTFVGGSLGEAHADTIVELHELAERAQVPVIGFIESAGARIHEGLPALDGYGRIFRQHVRLSGQVPQISIVCGVAAGGGSYGPALTDFIIMAGPKASMFLTGPAIVAKVMGEDADSANLGGPKVHDRNGVCHLVASTEVEGAMLARQLLGYLPQHAREEPMPAPAVDPPFRMPDVPLEDRRVYDVCEVVRALVDEGHMLEVSPRYARNVVCAFARLQGRSIGIIANQPRYLGGVLDAHSSQKAARFVRTCNAYGLPLVVLVDTPGFLPGTKQEHAGVIRHGATLVHAFAEASVPRVTVVLRKAFGGAFIAMNSKSLGADVVFAWPAAQLGVMGAEQAVEIIHRRAIADADDPPGARRTLAGAYADEHLGAARAAAEGFVDEIIAPSETRARVSAALASLATSGGDHRTPARRDVEAHRLRRHATFQKLSGRAIL